MVNEILQKEGFQSEEINIVSSGSSALSAMVSYNGIAMKQAKAIMFYPKIDPRFFASRGFSQLIVSCEAIFPKYYVEKQRDFLFWDMMRDEHRDDMFNKTKFIENEVIKSYPNYKALYFLMTNKSFEEHLNQITGSNNFKVEAIKRRNIYRNPDFVIKEIQKLDKK